MKNNGELFSVCSNPWKLSYNWQGLPETQLICHWLHFFLSFLVQCNPWWQTAVTDCDRETSPPLGPFFLEPFPSHFSWDEPETGHQIPVMNFLSHFQVTEPLTKKQPSLTIICLIFKVVVREGFWLFSDSCHKDTEKQFIETDQTGSWSSWDRRGSKRSWCLPSPAPTLWRKAGRSAAVSHTASPTVHLLSAACDAAGLCTHSRGLSSVVSPLFTWLNNQIPWNCIQLNLQVSMKLKIFKIPLGVCVVYTLRTLKLFYVAWTC